MRADLTAQVLHGNRIEAAAEVIDLCTSLGVTVMPLKGISISEQHYPAPHLRAMTDIDFLVSGRPYEEIEAAFLQRGYKLSPVDMGPDPAHGKPLQDCRRNVWVELHTSLFPPTSPLQGHPAFTQPSDSSVAIDSDFSGRRILRLRDEAQLLYIAAYWTRDLSTQSIHPTFITPLLDAIVLRRSIRANDELGTTFSLDGRRPGDGISLFAAVVSFEARADFVATWTSGGAGDEANDHWPG